MNVLVCGGGVCGLGLAMMLARDGHDVTVLERDVLPPPDSPDEAWESWDRGGVGQFRQAHLLHPRVRHVLDDHLPDVRDALGSSGSAYRYSALDSMPPMITDRDPRPGDDRFWSYTARRTTVEWVFARAAENEPRVTIERGVRVAGFITGSSAIDGVPHITGVRTVDGREILADVVIDAMGRRSSTPQWIQEIGGVPPTEEAEDCGFTYYTRFFNGDAVPAMIGPLNWIAGTFAILTLPSDNRTWSVTLWTATRDMPLKALRHNEVFDRVVRSQPMKAHWLDGQPLTDVLPMSGVVDRYRRFVVDGKPVATGLFAVADSWACTNPSAGRGIAIGIGHAARLRELLREGIGDVGELATRWHDISEQEFEPWYRVQVRSDRRAFAEMDARREGRELPPQPDDDFTKKELAFWASVPFDPDLFRAAMEIVGGIALPTDVFARADLIAKAEEIASKQEPFSMPELSRDELLELVS